MHSNQVMPRRGFSGRAAGFSLIELMIVVGVIAILAAIAYPNYREYVINSRRAAAAACLQEKAQLMERFYTTNLTYVGAGVPGGCDPEINGFYTFSVPAASPTTARTFTLQAVPVTGRQDDPKCGTLTINDQGTRTEGGAATNATECW
ncbi:MULTISPECIES: type IV pilin protein [unclassified Luteimonas]